MSVGTASVAAPNADARAGGLLERAAAPSSEDHMEARSEQAQGGSPAHSGPRAGDDRDPAGFVGRCIACHKLAA